MGEGAGRMRGRGRGHQRQKEALSTGGEIEDEMKPSLAGSACMHNQWLLKRRLGGREDHLLQQSVRSVQSHDPRLISRREWESIIQDRIVLCARRPGN